MSSAKGFPGQNGGWPQPRSQAAPAEHDLSIGFGHLTDNGQNPNSPAHDGGHRHPSRGGAHDQGFAGYDQQDGVQNSAHAAGQRHIEPTWGQPSRLAQPTSALQQPSAGSQMSAHPGWDLGHPGGAGHASPQQPARPTFGQASASPYGAAEGYAPQFSNYAAPTQRQPLQRSTSTQVQMLHDAAQHGHGATSAHPAHTGQTYGASPYGVPPSGGRPAGGLTGGSNFNHAAASAAQQASQWPAQHAEPRGYAGSGYPQAAQSHTAHGQGQAAYNAPAGFAGYTSPEPAQQHSEWRPQQTGYADGFSADAYQQPVDELGFAQAAGGELDPAYGEDDQDYEYEDAPRSRRPFMIAAALAGAIMVGGGLAFGYKTLIGSSGDGSPPVIKSAESPSKMKPADAGGKQFAHSDSKIMGRLGDGSAAVAAGGATVAGATDTADAGEADPNGTRKVATLVVGRDGSIQAPPEAPLVPHSTDSGVPGLTVVDAFGGQGAPAAPQVVNAPTAATAQAVLGDQLAPRSPPQSTGSVGSSATATAPDPDVTEPQTIAPEPAPPVKAAAKPAPKKVAALAPAAVSDAYNPSASLAAPVTATKAPAAASSSGANGYVAVLASVPRSSSSRMDALKRFADMQQKYSSALTGKTPDVAEANLGAKGDYHRLVVGPPASREQASALCTQLKAQGHTDCWVTAY